VLVRTFSALLCSLTFVALSATEALANGPGGAVAVEPVIAKSPATTGPHAPVTAKTSNDTYKGPVYEKTATGAIVPYQTPPQAAAVSAATGGATVASTVSPTGALTSLAGPEAKTELLVPGTTARYVDGLAAAPESAPAVVQEIIWAGNELIGLPYIYGGGHGSFISPGYDCSGTVSYALHGASLLNSPEDSGEFMGWGSEGLGRWVTIFTDPEHAYMTVAGLRLDTSAADDPTNEQGPRWRPLRQSNAGFKVRHPVGL
jgi:cell wall-associated NlpC family hydrolase